MATDPTLESVVAKAKADGKDDIFIRSLTEDYNQRFPAEEEEGLFQDFEEEPEVEEQDLDGPPPLDMVLAKAKDDGKSQGFLDMLKADYEKKFGEEPATHIDFGDTPVIQEEVDPENMLIEVTPHEVFTENFQSKINQAPYDYQGDKVDEGLQYIQDNATDAFQAAIKDDDELQRVMTSLQDQIKDEATETQQSIREKYNLTDPVEFEKAQKEMSEWYDGRFNELASGSDVYLDHMNGYLEEFNSYVREQSNEVGRVAQEHQVDLNREAYRRTLPPTPPGAVNPFDLPIVGDLMFEFSMNAALASTSTIPNLYHGFVNRNDAVNLQELKDLEENFDLAGEYEFVTDQNGKLLSPTSNRSVGRYSKSSEYENIMVSGEQAQEWVKERQQITRGEFIGRIATMEENNDVLAELHNPAHFLDSNGDFDWGQVNLTNISRLGGDQLPMMGAAIIPGGSVVLETGELMTDMTNAVAAKHFNKSEEEVTAEEMLYVIENDLVDTSLILDRGLLAGGMDLLAAGNVLKVTTSITKSMLKNGVWGAIKKDGWKNGVNYVASTGLEGVTEAGQGFVKQQAVEQITGRPINFTNLKEEGIAGLIFSGLLPIPGATMSMGSGVHKIASDKLGAMYANAVTKTFDFDTLLNHKDEVLIPYIQEQVESGGLTQVEGDEIIRDIEGTTKAAESLPSDISPADKAASIPIIKEINFLKDQIKGQDKAFTGKQKEKIKALEEELAIIGAKSTRVKTEDQQTKQAPTKEQAGDPNGLLKEEGLDPNQIEGIIEGREKTPEAAEGIIDDVINSQDPEQTEEVDRLQTLKSELKNGSRVTISDTPVTGDRSFESDGKFYTIGNVQEAAPNADAFSFREKAKVKTDTVADIIELAEGTPLPEVIETYKEYLVDENGELEVYQLADQTVDGNQYETKGVQKKKLSKEWSLAPVDEAGSGKYLIKKTIAASALDGARVSDGKVIVDSKTAPKDKVVGTNKSLSQTTSLLDVTEGFKQTSKTGKAIKAFQHGTYSPRFINKFFQRTFSNFRKLSLKAVKDGSMEVYTSSEIKATSDEFHAISKKRVVAEQIAKGRAMSFIEVRIIRAKVAEELSAKSGIPSSIVSTSSSYQNTDYLYFKNEDLAVSTVNGEAETVYFNANKDGYTHGTPQEILDVSNGADIVHNPDLNFWESRSAFAKLNFYEVVGAKIDLDAGNEFVKKHLPGYKTFDNVLAAEMERLIDIRNQERAEARDGVNKVKEEDSSNYKLDNKTIGGIRSDINAIINNINSITNESTFKSIQSLIGSSQEAQNPNSPLHIFSKGKKVPSRDTVARLFSGSHAEGRSNQVKLSKAYVGEARLRRTANWGNSYLTNVFNDLQAAFSGHLTMNKVSLDAGTQGAYAFSPKSQGEFLFNDKETSLDTLWHETNHWYDQHNMLNRPALSNHINTLTKEHVEYDSVKELMDTNENYEAFRNDAGYLHESQARIMGYESVRLLENYDSELSKPFATGSEHLENRYQEILEDIDSRINTVEDIKNMNDAAKVMIIEVMTGKDFFTGKNIRPSVKANKAASANAVEVLVNKKDAAVQEEVVYAPGIDVYIDMMIEFAEEMGYTANDLYNEDIRKQVEKNAEREMSTVWNERIADQAQVIKNVAGDPKMTERDMVIELTKQEVFGFMQELPGHIEEIQDKSTYEKKPTSEIKDTAGILASEKDMKVAEETVLNAIAQGKTMPEVSQGTGAFFKDYDDKGISARMAYVLQDLAWGDKVGSLVFQLGSAVFPGVKDKIEDPNAPKSIKGADVKTAQGVLGTHTLQLLIDAGLIDLDKKWDNATRKIINVVKFVDQKKFDAWIQSQNPDKVKNHVPRGSLPYLQNKDGTWEDSSWSEPNQDGMSIVGGKYDKQLLKELTKENFPLVYEEANSASEQILLIEQHMLATYQNMINQPAFTFKDQKLDAGALRSKIQKIVADLKMAEFIGDRPYKQRAVYELRSRLRSAMKALNHQGDKMGMSMIMFAEPVTVGLDGMEGMLIQASDTFGFQARDFDERVSNARDKFSDWMKWASDPVKHYEQIFAADEPWVFLATINELHNALTWSKKEGLPATSFKSGLPFHTDQTASGLGVITTIMKDSEHAGTLNIDSDQERGDPYTELGEEFFEKQGIHTQELMDESEAVATEWSKLEQDFYGSKSKKERDENKKKLDEFLKKYPKKKRNEMKQAYFSRLKIRGKYTRKMGKIIAMTKYFGGKIMGMSEQVMNELAPKIADFPGMPSEWAMSVAVDLDDAANSRFQAAARYMNITSEIGSDTAALGTRMTAPINGMPLKNRPNKFVPAQVPNKRYRGKNDKFGKDVSTKFRRKTENADAGKAATQTASFLTHMSDAQIVAWLFLNYTKAGNQLITIHDNFLVPVGQWRELYRELRKGYKEVFSGDYLANIIREVYENNGNPEKAEDIIKRLKIGDLDISEMDLSDHIFNSGNALERATPLPTIYQIKEGKKAMEEAQALLVSDKSEQIKNCK